MFKFHKNHSQLVDLFSKYLIAPNHQDVNSVYNQLEQYVLSSGKTSIDVGLIENLKEPFKTLIQVELKDVTTIAIDFPIYFKSPSQTDKTLMVCAMDSLPSLPSSNYWNEKNFDFTKNINFWAPFSLIDDWNNLVGSMKTNIPFFSTLLSEYNLYITDVYKIFFRMGTNNKWTNSNAIGRYTELKNNEGVNIHGTILSKEIEIVKPHAILTLGNAARNTVVQINNQLYNYQQITKVWGEDIQSYKWNNLTPIISLPHISGSANGAKSKILNNPKFSTIKGKLQNERFAKILMESLKTVI